MNFKVYNEGKSEKTTYFKLEEIGEGIALSSVNSDGTAESTILWITDKGFLRIVSRVGEDIGLKLDCTGTIIQEKE